MSRDLYQEITWQQITWYGNTDPGSGQFHDERQGGPRRNDLISLLSLYKQEAPRIEDKEIKILRYSVRV